jgi:hypothetical protein
MNAALIKGTTWYRETNRDDGLSRWFNQSLGGVEDGCNGINYTCFRTETTAFALVVDCRGPAAPTRGFFVLFFLSHERHLITSFLTTMLIHPKAA